MTWAVSFLEPSLGSTNPPQLGKGQGKLPETDTPACKTTTGLWEGPWTEAGDLQATYFSEEPWSPLSKG